jgi:hypothetical protein
VLGLFVLALLGALHVGRAVVLPILLALLLSLLLAPVGRGLRRLRLPRWLASALVVVAGGSGLICYLAAPAADWMDRVDRLKPIGERLGR